MKKALILELLKNYAVILLGCIIYSLGVSLFLDPNNLASGGVTGIAIALSRLTGLSTGILIIIINVPLFILGMFFFGKKFTLSSLFSTLVSSGLIELWSFLFKNFTPITENTLISAFIGGAMFGVGLGLIFRMGSTTGGTDIIIKILRKKFRHVKTGVISMIIDICIVVFAAVVNVYTGDKSTVFELTCYTVISIVIFTTAFDKVLYGGNSAKLVYIITSNEKAKEICDKILTELNIGATFVDGEGAYTGDEKRIILCAIKIFHFPRLRDIVREIDTRAFMIVSSAQEVYGEGYKNHTDDEL